MDVKYNVKKRREERIRELLSREAHMEPREEYVPQMPQMSAVEWMAGDGRPPADNRPAADSRQPENNRRPADKRQSNNAQQSGNGRQPANNRHPGDNRYSDDGWQPSPGQAEERDPERLWKQGRGLWRDNEPVYPPERSPYLPEPPARGSFLRAFAYRTVASVILFAGLWGIQHFQPAWSAPVRSFVSNSLSHDMNFAAIETWYEHNFGGAPSFIPIFGDRDEPQQLVQGSQGVTVPVAGTLAESFAISLKGVEIAPSLDSTGSSKVKSMETGRVTSVSKDALTGTTVIVQHSGGYSSVYGRLTKVDVAAGDWLESGDTVGEFSKTEGGSDTVYFAVKKDGHYIDPAEVVPLD